MEVTVNVPKPIGGQGSQSRNAWKAALCSQVPPLCHSKVLEWQRTSLKTQNAPVHLLHSAAQNCVQSMHHSQPSVAVCACLCLPPTGSSAPLRVTAKATERPVSQPPAQHGAWQTWQRMWSLESGARWPGCEPQLHNLLVHKSGQLTSAFFASVFPSE